MASDNDNSEKFLKVDKTSFWCAVLLCSCLVSRAGASWAESLNAGFLFDQFGLTLEEGTRTEAAGPFYYFEQKDTQRIWAVPPVGSLMRDPGVEATELDVGYPIFTYDRYGPEYRFQFFQVIAHAGGQDQDDSNTRRVILYPIYFHQWSDNPEREYFGVLPIYGKIKNHFFRNEVDWIAWPLYVKTIRGQGMPALEREPFGAFGLTFDPPPKGGIVTYNYLLPIFHLRFGEGLRGWQAWPLVGHERREVTVRTNEWGDPVTVPGHNRFFTLWPIFFKQHNGIGSENPEHVLATLPLFSAQRSPMRDSTTYLWPLGLTITHDRARNYHEVGAPWPFIVYAYGEGKTTRRVWPLFSQSSSTNLQSDFYLWPAYKYNRQSGESFERERTRYFLFLYSDTRLENTETEQTLRVRQSWPLFTHRKAMDGSTRLQVFSLLEPLLPNNKSIERNYSQLWSIWRSERNARTEATSQSLLWNLYRRDRSPEAKKVSLLFGLFQYQSSSAGRETKLFYIPVSRKATRAAAESGEGENN